MGTHLDPAFQVGHVPRNVFHTIDFLLEFSPMIRNKARVSEWQMDVEKNSHQDSRRRMRRMLFGFLDQHDQPTFCRHT